MRLPDAEDLWLACVMLAPKYADHSLVTEDHLSYRGKTILNRIRAVHRDGWPMVAPDQIENLHAFEGREDLRDLLEGNAGDVDLRTIPRRIDTIDAETSLPQAETALIEAWAREKFREALREAAEICGEKGRGPAERYLADVTLELQANSAGLHWRRSAEVIREVLEEIAQRLSNVEESRDLGSGIAAVDMACNYFPAECATTIGGYTNEGKSTLTLQIVTGLALSGRKAAMISLEDRDQIMGRRQLGMLVEELAVAQRLADKETTAADLALLKKIAHEVVENLDVEMVHIPGAGVDRVCHAIQDAARRGARVIAVDYLQCFEADRGIKRSETLGRNARRMKSAAAQVGAHLIIVSQVRRPKDADARGNAPTMYMLKESGDIENLSEYVLLVWRPQKGKDADIERAKIVVDKSKDGNVGVIDLGWDQVRHMFTEEPPDEAEFGQREMGDQGYTYDD